MCVFVYMYPYVCVLLYLSDVPTSSMLENAGNSHSILLHIITLIEQMVCNHTVAKGRMYCLIVNVYIDVIFHCKC